MEEKPTLVYGKQPPFFSDPHGDLTMQYDPAKDEVLPQGGPEQTELDRLVIGMLNPDFKSRIGTPEILQRLMGYMQTMPDFTSEVIEMVSLTPQARGEEPLPKCLWNWDRPLRDIGDQKFTREDCGDDSTERETKEKDSSNKACQCHVLRKGQIVQEHFNAPECL
ncbi:unnamed protein product [Durusdinium trenchii]|uniref:Uncharacterized protein n=1 Tax=Durusdinium trenchii TaxID=1381693 RepID=A0ABP0KDU5_9DINO